MVYDLVEITGNIYCIGYYNHNNLGDEQYKITVQKLFDKEVVIFVDCDHIEEQTFKESDVILFGPGDVLNNYFIDKLINKIKKGPRPSKIIALSVGIPYISILVDTNKLNIFDHIYLRTMQDIDILKKFYGPNVTYIPDVSCLLKNENSCLLKIKDSLDLEKTVTFQKKPTVCISLCHTDNEVNNSIILSNTKKLISFLIQKSYSIVLLPFNTNTGNKEENDILVHEKLYMSLDPAEKQHVDFIKKDLDPIEAFRLFKDFDLVCSMRFHGCQFAFHNKKPFIAMNGSRKNRNFLKDINSRALWTAEDGQDLVSFVEKSICMTEKNILVTEKNILETGDIGIDINSLKNDILKNEVFLNSNNGFSNNGNYVSETQQKISNFILKYGFRNIYDVDNEYVANTIVKYMSYRITGNIDSVYNYGIRTKLFKEGYKFNKEFLWSVKDFYDKKDKTFKILEKTLQRSSKVEFNLNFKNQDDTSQAHRSGWKYVYDSLRPYHKDSSEIFLDLYVDETFHWNYDVYKLIGLIPYTKSWYGFIHHTFDKTFSDYNCYNLLKNEDFLKSLQSCKALIVLSTNLKSKLENHLFRIGINVPIFCIYHPTEFTGKKFSMKKFLNNEDKKIISVGNWLRDTYYFYKCLVRFKNERNYSNFCFGQKEYSIRKVALSGKNKNNYFPTYNFYDHLKEFLIEDQAVIDDIYIKEKHCSTHEHGHHRKLSNNWYIGFSKDLKKALSSVEIFEFKNSDDYDNLLVDNIVFVKLIDASAVNTLIECIVRETPLVISKHPAVVELLGPGYPLYLEDLEDVFVVNLTIESIRKANIYLRSMDKTCLKIETFTNSLFRILKNIS
jgi:hypothetical protein